MSDDSFLDDLFDLGSEDITHVDRQTFERAPFGMPGGKTNSLKHILPRLPVRRKWVDHFGEIFLGFSFSYYHFVSSLKTPQQRLKYLFI